MVSLRVAFVSHASTDALRLARIPADESLNEVGRRECARREQMSADRVRVAPELRAIETAQALGLVGESDPGLSEIGYGSWRGLETDQLPPDDFMAWLTDPEFKPDGVESIVELIARVSAWLFKTAAAKQHTIAVTHPAVIRAAIVSALDAPATAFWRIDIPPLSVTRFHYRGVWTLRSTGYDYPKLTP